MDPVSSLSLACNVLQLVEFSSKVVVGAADLYKDGTTQENAEIKDVTDSLLRFTSSLRTSVSADKHDNELKDIANQADKVGTELAALLRSLDVPKDAEHRKWKSVHVTVRSMYKREEVKSLESRLQSLQRLLNTWMIQSTRDKTSAVSRQVTDLTEQQKDLGAETNRSLENMKHTLFNIQGIVTENQRAIQGLSQDSGHGEPTQQSMVSSGGWFSVLGTVKQYFSPGPYPTAPGSLDDEDVYKTREARMKDDMRFWPDVYEQLNLLSDEAKLVVKGQQVLRSLYDPELVRRYVTVEQEYPDTCRWIFDNPEHGFKDWLESGHETYWISGKPGAGKTTLMKYICDSEETQNVLQTWSGAHELLIIKHFFWISGTELQSSSEGLLRSLLFQILRHWPSLIPLICSTRICGDEFTMKEPWGMRELSSCLTSSITKLPPQSNVCFFIDGLDEYKGNHQEVVSLLDRLVSPDNIKLCVSSRIWTVFQKAYGSNVRQLRVEDLTRTDLRRYVEGRLLGDEHLGPMLATETITDYHIVERLLENARGVFLWLRYVVSLLLKDAANDPTLMDLHRLIGEYPQDIDPLFERMLQSLDASPFAQEAAQILFFRSQISNGAYLTKVWFLEIERRDPNYALNRSIRPFTDGERRQFTQTLSRLRGRCMDFIEVYDVEQPTGDSEVILTGWERIEFSHRTARDFLQRKYDWLRKNAGPDFDPSRSACKAHLASLKACRDLSIDGTQDDLAGMLLAGGNLEQWKGGSLVAEIDEAQRVYEKLSMPSEPQSRHQSTAIFSYSKRLQTEPSFSFLALATRWGLFHSVGRRLERLPETEKTPELLQSLLDISLRFDSLRALLESSMVQVPGKIVEMLLSMGASPNAIIQIPKRISVWQAFLRDIHHRRKDDEFFTASAGKAVQLLLEHKADPFVTVPLDDPPGIGVFTLDQILEARFPSDDAVFEKLAEARARLKGKGKFWRKIKRR